MNRGVALLGLVVLVVILCGTVLTGLHDVVPPWLPTMGEIALGAIAGAVFPQGATRPPIAA